MSNPENRTPLGKGSYGTVEYRDGLAVKTFTRISHLVQEYLALRYLRDTKYIVKARDVDFTRLEMSMDLCSYNVRQWIETKWNQAQAQILVADVLKGLIELHERGLAHGDLKPGNILVVDSDGQFTGLLGDCGFVSVAKHAKVNKCAPAYREKKISRSWRHDMYSFGICLINITTRTFPNVNKLDYAGVIDHVNSKVSNRIHREILFNLLSENKKTRMSARQVYDALFGIKVGIIPVYNNSLNNIPNSFTSPSSPSGPNEMIPKGVESLSGDSNSPTSTESKKIRILDEDHFSESSGSNKTLHPKHREQIRAWLKANSRVNEIKRGNKGYGLLVYFLQDREIEVKYYHLYMGVTLLILSSTFGKRSLKLEDIMTLTKNKYDVNMIIAGLESVLDDDIFVDKIMVRSHHE